MQMAMAYVIQTQIEIKLKECKPVDKKVEEEEKNNTVKNQNQAVWDAHKNSFC